MRDLADKHRYSSNEIHTFLGYFLILMGGVSFVYGWYSLVISKYLIGETGHPVLDWIRNDTYYCFAVPAYLLIMVFIVYFNWLFMKYFRHSPC